MARSKPLTDPVFEMETPHLGLDSLSNQGSTPGRKCAGTSEIRSMQMKMKAVKSPKSQGKQKISRLPSTSQISDPDRGYNRCHVKNCFSKIHPWLGCKEIHGTRSSQTKRIHHMSLLELGDFTCSTKNRKDGIFQGNHDISPKITQIEIPHFISCLLFFIFFPPTAPFSNISTSKSLRFWENTQPP